jgi:hypothetical protein
MGLDTRIYLFSKSVYDELADGEGRVDYMVGRDKGVEVCYYRKHQSLQDILGFVCDGTYGQATYHRLSKERMIRAVRLASRLSKNGGSRWNKEELVILSRDLMKILTLIDFDITAPSFLWVS